MTNKPSEWSGPLRHGAWGIFSFLLLFANVLCAANLPRFAFSDGLGIHGTAVAVDSQGNTYITGYVDGNALTATAGAYQSQNNGGSGGVCFQAVVPKGVVLCRNAFVMKLDPSGAVVFATYLGGTGSSQGFAIAVDSQQNVYVTGTVNNGGFPVTPFSAFPNDANDSGLDMSWVAKLNPSGTQLVYSTLIPAALIVSIAVDGAGSLYFTGSSEVSAPFQATPGAFQTAPLSASNGAAIIGKLNAWGSSMVYGTYLSGSLGGTSGVAIAVDAAGNAMIAGSTNATDFPATSGQFSPNTFDFNSNAYVAKFNANGSQLIYATLLGPAAATAMKTDAGGDLYIACNETGSAVAGTVTGFGVAPPTAGGGSFLLHVSVDGSTLLSSVYLPFSLSSYAGLDVDSVGNSYIAGTTATELPFAMSSGAFQPVSGAFGKLGMEGVVAKITPGGQVAGVTYLGGSQGAWVTMIAAERDGSVVLGGLTNSGDFLGLPVKATGLGFFFATNIYPAITIENSASYVANTVVPGELVSLRAYGMGPAVGVSGLPVTKLAGVQVFFDNSVAPVTYAQAGQVNVQAPWEIAGQISTQVTIRYNGAEVGSVVVPVGSAMPGVFFINNSDGSRNSPSNPARAGDYVAVYGTGGGAMSPAGVTGASWPLIALSQLSQKVSVAVGGETGGIIYAGSAPTLDSGFFQIDVRLPSDLTSGAQSLCVTIGGVKGAAAALSIQ